VQIARERCERCVIRKPLEEFADVRDPERALKAGANLVEAFRKGQKWLLLMRMCSISLSLSSRAPLELRWRGESKSRDLGFFQNLLPCHS
jgi:hypothetical protein